MDLFREWFIFIRWCEVFNINKSCRLRSCYGSMADTLGLFFMLVWYRTMRPLADLSLASSALGCVCAIASVFSRFLVISHELSRLTAVLPACTVLFSLSDCKPRCWTLSSL